MGMLHAFWKSFDDVFANKYIFVLSLSLLLIIEVFGTLSSIIIQNSSINCYSNTPVNVYSGGAYNSAPPPANCISLPLIGTYIDSSSILMLVILFLLLFAMTVLLSLAYIAQGYDIITNKTLSIKRSLSSALKKLPVAFLANLLTMLINVITFSGIFLISYYLLNMIGNMSFQIQLISEPILIISILILSLLILIFYIIFFYFVNVSIMVENKGVIGSIKRSIELSKNRKTKIFGTVFLSTFIYFIFIFIAALPFILYFMLGLVFTYTGQGYQISQIFNIASSGNLMNVLFTYIPLSIGFFVLLAGFFFINTWIGMIPVYLYMEFMMNKKQRTNKSNPVQIQ